MGDASPYGDCRGAAGAVGSARAEPWSSSCPPRHGTATSANEAGLDAAGRSEGELVALVRVVPDEVDAVEKLLDAGAAG